MRKLWLASSSPRRRLLLEDSGFHPECVSSDLDDDLLRISDESVHATCAARAWFKAESVHDLLSERNDDAGLNGRGVLVAATFEQPIRWGSRCSWCSLRSCGRGLFLSRRLLCSWCNLCCGIRRSWCIRRSCG